MLENIHLPQKKALIRNSFFFKKDTDIQKTKSEMADINPTIKITLNVNR